MGVLPLYADKWIVNQDEIQTEFHIQSFTYLERGALLPELAAAIDGAGGWMLDRRQISANAVEMNLEVQQQCLPEVYGALLSSGLELSRESHRMLVERCNCCMHLPNRRGVSSILTLHVDVVFLSDPQHATDIASLMTVRSATA
ncbi:MAG: hypothetical protein ACRYGF_14405 [Janthinobacterium lividum]